MNPKVCVQSLKITMSSKQGFEAGHNVGWAPGEDGKEGYYFFHKQANRTEDVVNPKTGKVQKKQKKVEIKLNKEQLSLTTWTTTHKKYLLANNNTGDGTRARPIIPMPQDRYAQLVQESSKKPKKRKRKKPTTKAKPTPRQKKKKTLTPPKADNPNTDQLVDPQKEKYTDLLSWSGYGAMWSLMRVIGMPFFQLMQDFVESDRGIFHPAILGSMFTEHWCKALKSFEHFPRLAKVNTVIDLDNRGAALGSFKLGVALILHIYAEKPRPAWSCPGFEEMLNYELNMDHPGVRYILTEKGVNNIATWTDFLNFCAYPQGDEDAKDQLASCTLYGMFIGFMYYVIQ